MFQPTQPTGILFSEKSKSFLLFFCLLFFCLSVIFTAGLMSQASLGDEIHHYRFAKHCFYQSNRAIFDSVYGTDAFPAIHYTTDPAWPLGLAALWKIAGHISPILAQGYHVFFYALLMTASFLTARAFYGEKQALWTALLVGTTPMIVSFSILFYTDMPATAWIFLGFFCFIRKRFFEAGILLGLAYLTKKTTLFFMPGAAGLILFSQNTTISERIKSLGKLLIPFGVLVSLELLWQRRHFHSDLSLLQGFQYRLQTIYEGQSAKPFFLRIFNELKNNEFSNSHLLNLTDNLKYFGVVLAVLFLFRLVLRRFEKKENAIWIFMGSYFLSVLFLRLLPDIRYLMPMVPFLCLVAADFAVYVSKKRWVQWGMILFACLQLVAGAWYTGGQRRIPEGVQQGFDFMQKSIPQNDLILYPEINILEYANRPMVWGYFQIRKLFWGTEQEKLAQLSQTHIRYIAVKKNRVYEDLGMKTPHIGGYPKSFLRRFANWSFLSLVFENDAMSIWKVDSKGLSEQLAVFEEKKG